jgi:hypothetical protein
LTPLLSKPWLLPPPRPLAQQLDLQSVVPLEVPLGAVLVAALGAVWVAAPVVQQGGQAALEEGEGPEGAAEGGGVEVEVAVHQVPPQEIPSCLCFWCKECS